MSQSQDEEDRQHVLKIAELAAAVLIFSVRVAIDHPPRTLFDAEADDAIAAAKALVGKLSF